MGSTRLYGMATRRWFISGMRLGAIGLAPWLTPALAQPASTRPHAVQVPPQRAPAPHHAHLRHHRRQTAVHVPHPPPAPALPVETAAPLPNENEEPPREQLQPGLNVVPGNLQLHFPPSGDGYLPASSEQTLDDTRTPRVPGVTLTVPLGQPNQSGPP